MSEEKPDTTLPLGETNSKATAESPAPGGTVTTSAILPDGVAPAGEDIHLPPGSIIPFAIALAVTLTLVGTTVWWGWTIMGGILFVVCLGLWIRDTRREVAHLPDEHGSPAHH